MARYIDANKLIERLMHNPNFLTAPKHSKDGIIDEIVGQPTANVAPRDEVRADTIKEFADRVKKYYHHLLGFSSPMLIGYYIDQIAKEMLGGDGNASDQNL